MNTLCLNLTQVNCLNCPPHLLRYPSEEQCHIKLAVKADVGFPRSHSCCKSNRKQTTWSRRTDDEIKVMRCETIWMNSTLMSCLLWGFAFEWLNCKLCCQFLFFLCQNSCLWLANLKAEKNTQTHTHTQTKKKLYLWGFTRCKSLTDKSSSAFRHVEIF